MKPTSLKRHLVRWAWVVPVLITAFVFWKTKQHAFRADQFLYSYMWQQLNGFMDIVVKFHHVNRVIYGEPILFRPFLHSLLGLEYYIFGYNFESWQLASLVFHLAAVASFFYMLRALRPGNVLLPAIFSVWFGVLYVGMEQVIWHHISGYLVAYALLFFAVGLFAKGWYEAAGRWRNWRSSLAVFLVASFFYEFGVIFAGCVVLAAVVAVCLNQLLLRWSNNGGFSSNDARVNLKAIFLLAAASFVIPLVFSVWNLIDLKMTGHEGVFEAKNSAETFKHGARIGDLIWAVGNWFGGSIFPGSVRLTVGPRMEVESFFSFLTVGNRRVFIAAIWIGLSIVAGNLLQSRVFKRFGRDFWVYLMFGLAILAYAGLIVFGRGQERGVAFALRNASYYAYFPSALSLSIVYILMPDWDRLKSWVKMVVVIPLIYMVFANARLVRQQIDRETAYLAATRATIQRVKSIVAENPNAKIRLHDDCIREMSLPWFDVPKNRNFIYTIPETMYPEIIVRSGSPDWPILSCASD